MHDHPHGGDLIAIARDTFVNEILPVLPASKRLSGLMVASALAMVDRELAAGDNAQRRLHAALAAIYDVPVPLDREGVAESFRALTTRLARDLRAGTLREDRERLNAIHRALCDAARARVMISNPKYLDASDGDRLTSR